MAISRHWNLAFSLWAAVSFFALLTISSTNAAQCRHLEAVQNSMKSLDDNVALGGHVWIHVWGQEDKPSKEKPEVGKSMWISEADLMTAWNAWKAELDTKTKATCAKTSEGYRDCVPKAKLGGVTQLYKCTKVVNNECTEHDGPFDVVAARFDYAFKKVGSKSQWIVNTAWPSQTSNCL